MSMNLIGSLMFVVSISIPTQTNAQEPETTYCPAGSFGDHASCTLCTPGTYAKYAGQQDCYNCHVGSYADVAGATSCTLCPVDYHSSPFEGGTTFEGTCKPNTVAKIKMKVGLPISLADFGTRIQKYFKLSIALALQIGVSNVAITEVKDTTITSLDNRRRLLQEDDESWSIEVTTTTTVPSANVNSTIAFFSQQRVISELQLSTGIVSSYVSTPEVTHISTRHTTLMKSEKRLISFISACPCVQSQ
jgi:hypothetical protein